ncbi:MAG: hypothetical protein QM737_06295 [Ferruginibacter sp.]
MRKHIVISFSAQIDPIQRAWISEKLNSILEPINKEVNGWNGFVDYIEAEPGYYVLIAKCDNDEIREMMQLLIDQKFPKTNTETKVSISTIKPDHN